MLQTPSIFLTLLATALLLGPLVMVHELGHYLVGRWCGVKALAFSIGFGREIAGWTDKRGTRWKLSLLPLGGYVQFAGDMNAASMPLDSIPLDVKEREGWFPLKPLWQRFLIVLAGPLTNLIVAVLIFAGFNMAYGTITAAPIIGAFEPGSPAQAAGMQQGDRITAIDGHPIRDFTQIAPLVLPFPDKTVAVAATRAGAPKLFAVKIARHTRKDQFGNSAQIGMLGIASGGGQRQRLGPVESLTTAVGQTYGTMGMMVTGIRQIFAGERSVRELGGPIKIAKFSGQRFALGWQEFVYFVAFISINLAFINLLPIPVLDGGHLAFYVAEALRGKPVGARGQEWAYRTGLAFVLALMVFVTINDVLPADFFGL